MTPTPTTALPAILYLEDDDDIRELLCDLLCNAGYDVTALGTSEAALEALRGPRHYELLLTDYRLPLKNADWLLAKASGEDLLQRTAVIILTGEPQPHGVGNFLVLRKPVDVGLLLGHVARAIDHKLPPVAIAEAVGVDARISLRLYVSESLESLKAERHLQSLLAVVDENSGRPLSDIVSLTTFDVTKTSAAMLDAIEEDRVIVTPTLVRRAPGPRAAILGDLSRRSVVETLLHDALELAPAGPPVPRAPSAAPPATATPARGPLEQKPSERPR